MKEERGKNETDYKGWMIAEKEKKKEKKKEVSLDYGSTIITEISVPLCFLLSQSVYGSTDSQLCTT